MFTEQWSRVVSASVAPAVIISATALLCLAFYNRLATIVARLRAVQRERMQEQEHLETMSLLETERCSALRRCCMLESLAEQTARIRRRAHLVRATLMCFLGAIACLVVSSLLNGLTTIWPDMMFGTALLFLLGMTLLLAGVFCAMGELLVALNPAELETDVISELTGDPGEEPAIANGRAR
jgi:Protein of unknown function (DUF2721)